MGLNNDEKKLNDVATKYGLGKINWQNMTNEFKTILATNTAMPIQKITDFEFSIFLLVLMVHVRQYLDGEKNMLDFKTLME